MGANAQPGTNPSLHGVITDPSGAIVPGAVVELRGPGGEKRARTNASGMYSFGDLAGGKYRVRIAVKGFAPVERRDLVITRAMGFDAQLAIRAGMEVVHVQDESGRIGTEPSSNGGGVFMRQRQVAELSDDPDELALQLQALAGPAPGPNGGQVFIDGFTGVNLPPKSAIREVRINANPFSPEYDRPGFSRIEIFTKPGSESLRGQAFAQFNDDLFNSRNPLLAQSTRPPYRVRMFGVDVSGPLKKSKASFTLGVEHRRIDESGIILATTLDSELKPVSLSQAVAMPQTRTSATPRVDYAINSKNTLAVRYQELRIRLNDIGAGDFNLPSRAYDEWTTNRIVQATETAVFSPKAISETRFQFARTSLRDRAKDFTPAINVLDAFAAGGAPINNSSSVTNSVEPSNVSMYTSGNHSIKWGGRVRQARLTDTSRNNFAGSFTFLSLEDYRQTLAGVEGARPWQFTMNSGMPTSQVQQADLGLFVNDDWKARPNVTLSFGLRYEMQTNLDDQSNWAPRVGVAWAIDAKANRPARTVLRAGAGLFFDRVPASVTLNALRYDGTTQRSYVISNPAFFPTIPLVDALPPNEQLLRPRSGSLRAGQLYQVSIGIERQLTRNARVTASMIQSRGVHLPNARNVNTPVGGVYPYDDRSIRLLTESSGSSRLSQFIISPNVNYRKFSLYGFYALSHGQDNNEGLPADPYNMRAEWGPSTYGDVRHRVVAMSSIPLWKISVAPFFAANTGVPYNITTGLDPEGTGFPTARPVLLGRSSCVAKACFDANPAMGPKTIGRNFGRGPAAANLGMRVGYTWAFGGRGEGSGMDAGSGGTHGGTGGPPLGMFAANTGRKYNVTLSATTLNALNHANYGPPNGNLASPYFGQSRSLGGLIVMSHGGSQTAYNRKVDFQLRVTF